MVVTEIDDFVELLASNREVGRLDASEDTDLSEEDREGFTTILNREIDKLTGEYSFDISVSIDELRSAGDLLGKTEVGLFADSIHFQVKPLRVELADGKIEAEYSARYLSGGLEAELEVDIKNLEFGGLLRLLDEESEATGALYLETSLMSSAAGWDELNTGIRGTLDMVLFPENVEAGILDLWASNLILALLPAKEDSGKKMNCMVARFEIQDGVMESKNTFLDSTDIIVRGRGTIDLGNQQLDLLAVPQAKRERFFSVSAPIEITGSFDDFNVGVAPTGFFMTMTRWYYALIYVPWKWATGETFPEDGIATCYKAMEWDLPGNEN